MHVNLRLLTLTVILLGVAVVAPRVIRRIARRLRERYHDIVDAWNRRPPRRTLRCVPRSPLANWWEVEPLDGRPTLKLVSDWQITNISARTVRVVRADPERPALGWTRLIRSSVSVQRPEGGLFGDYEIPPGLTVAAVVESWFARPAQRPDDRLTTNVNFVDSLGNRHVVKRVPFAPLAGLRGTGSNEWRRDASGASPAHSNTRRRVRASVSFSTDVLVEKPGMAILARGRCLVLSASGACLELGRDYPIGSTLSLRFRLPATAEDIACRTVVRNGRGRSVGVEFVNLPPDDSDRIDAFVQRQRVRLA